MKIGKLIGRIQTKLDQCSYARKEARIDQYFKLHDYDTFGDSFNQMYKARETVARYAAEKAVQIDVYDAKRLVDGTLDLGVKPKSDAKLSDKIIVAATNIFNGKLKWQLVSADTGKVYPKIADKGLIILPIKGENKEIARKRKWCTEDTFLRNLYRSVENLTNEVTRG